MQENGNELVWDTSREADSLKNFPERQPNQSFNTIDKTHPPLENPICKDEESSKILKRYLQNLRSCTRRKQHRCISQDLGD